MITKQDMAVPHRLHVQQRRGWSIIVEHTDRSRAVDYHFHPEYEFLLALGGTGRQIVGDRAVDHQGQSLVLTGPDLPHGWTFHEDASQRLGRELIVVAFTRESLGIEFLQKKEMVEVRAMLDRAERGLAFSDEAIGIVQPDAERLMAVSLARRFPVFLSILIELAQRDDTAAIVSQHYNARHMDRDHKAFGKVLTFVQETGLDTITLNDAAAHVNMSVASFTRFFKRMTGKTLVSYMNEWRINRACMLLSDTKRSILNVALDSGFSNLSHFNRQFLKITGTTPRRYRKHCRDRR